MKPSSHLIASAVVSTSIYMQTKSETVSIVSFLSGFLIDIDHCIDYVREYGFKTDVKEFFRIFHETRFKKLFLVFHAWEWLPLLLFLAWFYQWNEIILGVFIGVFHHLILDQFANGFSVWGYSIIYRAKKTVLYAEYCSGIGDQKKTK